MYFTLLKRTSTKKMKNIITTYSIIKTKWFNTWGISASVASIVQAIIMNTKECITVSTHIKGCRHGVTKDKDIFMSLPCILGTNGINCIVRQSLNEAEKDQIQKSADRLNVLQSLLEL